MDITIDQLSVWRAKNMWDHALNFLFKQVDRDAYHQYIETLEPVRLWKGELILRESETQLDTIKKEYSSIILSALQKQSAEVTKILFLGSKEKDAFHIEDKQGWIIEPQFIQRFWEQVLDQVAKQKERAFYEEIRNFVQPLARVNHVLLVGMDHYGMIMKNFIESDLRRCVQKVDSSIECLEYLEIPRNRTGYKELKLKQKRTTVTQERELPSKFVAGKELWAEVIANLSEQISRPSLQTWFLSTKFISCEEGTLTISAPNRFSRDWIESRYLDVVKEQVSRVNPSIKWIKVISEEENEQQIVWNHSMQKIERKNKGFEERLHQIEMKLEEILQKL